MRMRKKPNLLPRMEKASAVYIHAPEEIRGAWKNAFSGYSQLHLELGCGKGRFTAETARANPGVFFVALERVQDAIVVGMERATGQGLSNVRFISRDAAALRDIFAPGEVDRIYINFCDPWPKSRDAKHRLTAPSFLRLYADLLPAGGEICFKTDNLPLFEWSVVQLESENWDLTDLTRDLHANGVRGVMTDYEEKFHGMGIKINRLAAKKREGTKSSSDGVPPRPRNASLTDARGYADSAAAARTER